MENRNAGQQSAGQESAVQEAAAQGTAAVRQSSSLLLMGLISLALFGLVVALFWRFIAAAEAFTFGFLILILLGFLPLLLAVLLAARIAARFAQRLYDLPRLEDGLRLLEYALVGRPIFPPKFSIVRQGKVHHGDSILERFGGPGRMFLTSDSAVILQRNGRLTRLLHQPQVVELEPFEKVWDVLELRPRRWVYDVGAITKDGIPVTVAADVRFQIDLTGDSDEQESAIWKAAACTWIRDAWRTEPDRLMNWPKRVIISATEGSFRNILAGHDLDDLLEEPRRSQVRDELAAALNKALPGLGVRLLGVELGDLKVEDEVVKQWMAAWRAEKTHAEHARIAEGMAERARALEQAKVTVRKEILEETFAQLRQAQKENEKIPAQLVLLSCIEVVKQAEFNSNFILPRDILNMLDTAEKHLLERKKDPEQAPESPAGP